MIITDNNHVVQIAAQNDNGSSVLDLRGMFREFLDKLPVVNSRLIKRETQDFYRRLWVSA
jgi:hypothetical protein